jgi:hypothetical protein
VGTHLHIKTLCEPLVRIFQLLHLRLVVQHVYECQSLNEISYATVCPKCGTTVISGKYMNQLVPGGLQALFGISQVDSVGPTSNPLVYRIK